MIERTICEAIHERITTRDGSVDVLIRSSRTILTPFSWTFSHVIHIDSESGRFVTSTDHELFQRTTGSIGPSKSFWDKRVPLSLKLRS